MRSEWDMPRPASHTVHTDAPRREQAPDGILDPMALLALFSANLIRIGVIAAVLTAVGVAALMLYPFPYKAKAIVIADPREQRVTLQEEVLPTIGSDAAVLESMVQIVKSDGFLLDAMQNLGLLGEPGKLNQTGRLQALAKFRKKLTVERKGATYLVEIGYSANDGAEAARIANGVAGVFADSQNNSRNDATQNAAKSLSRQLIELRANLNKSEEAVAQFKAENGIVYIDQNNTLQMRQLTELSQQLALAKNATEEARARYDEVKSSGGISVSGTQSGEGGQLAYLRQQRAALAQSLEQQRQIYGPRHPRIVQTQQMLRGMDNQIAQERQVLARQIKATLDVAAAKQKELERQIASLSSGVSLTESAQVKLDALEREAAANREIYQQFLSRNKQTDQMALIAENNVRVVSAAVPPLRSTRPSLTLVGPALALLSLAIATFVTIGGHFSAILKPGAGSVARPARPLQPRVPGRPVAAASRQRKPAAERKPRLEYEPVSLLDAWGENTGDNDVSPLNAVHERMAARGGRSTRLGGWRRAG